MLWDSNQTRIQRIRLVAQCVAGVFLFIGLMYWAAGLWRVGLVLTLGAAGVAYSTHQGLLQHSQRGVAGILWVVWATISALMWLSEGLRDASVLAYPIILLLAGLLLGRKRYLRFLVAMLVFVVVLTVSTEVTGWRQNTSNSNNWELLRDVVIILLACAFIVWMTVADWRRMIAALEAQIESYRQSQAHLLFLSQHDALTGLTNRSRGRHLLEQAITQARVDGTGVALMFIDLDNFKFINDSVGHVAGDEFLRQIAIRLSTAVRDTDIVVRQSGDEFLVGLLDVPDSQSACSAATEVLDHLGGVYTVRGTALSSTCSIGVARFPQDGADFETLLRHADLAMYQAKQAGRNTFRLFDVRMQDGLSTNPRLVAEMRSALQRGEFELHYQPVVDLTTQRLLGAEALVRWHHPRRGMLAPADFIPAAEHSGLIVDIGRWVIEEACRQTARWRNSGHALVVAVNISPVQCQRGDLTLTVHSALARASLPGTCLELEITESVLMGHVSTFAETVRGIKAMGVSIAIDDFGTGYSNFGYLQQLAADKIKIDQSFVRSMLMQTNQHAIVTAIIQMGKSLGMRSHAEGVESAETCALLVDMGCDIGQGYWFGAPSSAVAFTKRFLGSPPLPQVP
ncbi:MAG: bifunctional diguanylate cyclase/phosphodiesterase [Rhodoferax sp.]|nr:bifunctional diguanylate cyclase/phosphodiesterase [Rhodoferax sp.]